MVALDVIGSDVDHFECPYCGAHDRERHLLLYLRASGLLADLKGKSLAHFAPEPQLSRVIVAAGPGRYIKCDLVPAALDVARVDMLRMPFESESFDLLIANHVLEHVADDLQAIAEIRRVLKIGGQAILQTPFSRKLSRTWEDPGIDSDRSRTQAYGQADHVRLFGRDVFTKIEEAGFQSMVQEHESLLAGVDADAWGVNGREPFFLFRRVR